MSDEAPVPLANLRRTGALLTGLLITVLYLLQLDIDAQLGVKLFEMRCEGEAAGKQVYARNFDGWPILPFCAGTIFVVKVYDQGGVAGIIRGHTYGIRGMGSKFQQAFFADSDLVAGERAPTLHYVVGQLPFIAFDGTTSMGSSQ